MRGIQPHEGTYKVLSESTVWAHRVGTLLEACNVYCILHGFLLNKFAGPKFYSRPNLVCSVASFFSQRVFSESVVRRLCEFFIKITPKLH